MRYVLGMPNWRLTVVLCRSVFRVTIVHIPESSSCIMMLSSVSSTRQLVE